MKSKQTHVVYGFVTAVAMVVLGLILYISDLAFEPWAQWVSYIPFIIGLILNANAYAKANDNYVTFGNVFSSGFKASAIIAIVSLAWSFIMLWIFPEMKEKGMEMAQERMTRQGMSDEQIEQGMQISENYFIPMMIGAAIFGTMFVGAIFSLIAAAIPKKKGERPPHLDV